MGIGCPVTVTRRAIFLDRDGVINQAIVRKGKPYPPNSLEELVLTDGAFESLIALKKLGFLLLVVTNQPDVARGKQAREVVEAINTRLMEQLPLDKIYTCYHDDADDCTCRKPRPGLILQGAQEWEVEPALSILIGDRYKDIEAGQGANCTTILVNYGYNEPAIATPDYIVQNLVEAVRIIEKVGVS